MEVAEALLYLLEVLLLPPTRFKTEKCEEIFCYDVRNTAVIILLLRVQSKEKKRSSAVELH
jgi:hypothetical protein